MHRVYVETGLPEGPGEFAVEGEEATHALRVKRLRADEPVELLDGRGGVASGKVIAPREGEARGRSAVLRIAVERIERREAVRPEVIVMSATPKGGRVDEMIDGLSQVGAAEWRPLRSARGVVDPREGKLDRLGRIAAESMKQCGRAWVMRIGEVSEFAEAVRGAAGVRVILAHAEGLPFEAGNVRSGHVRLLVGPEGGFTAEEIAAAVGAGAETARFGPHTMRIESAAVVAAGIVLSRSGGESV